MRFLTAMVKHETNTFSPVATPLARFARGLGAVPQGAEALSAFRDTGSALGGFIDVAEREGVTLVCTAAGEAWPSGPVQRAAFDWFCEGLVDELARGGFDGILLDLHGAMVVDGMEEGEAELIARLAKVAPGMPIAVAFDMHANLSERALRCVAIASGYKTYPHVDRRETGRTVAALLVRAVRGEIAPRLAFGRAPMMPHIMCQGTYASPNRELQAAAEGIVKEGNALAASLFLGFPHADVPSAGLSAVVVTDADMTAARSMVDSLLASAWEARHAFLYRAEPLSSSLLRAAAIRPSGRPAILLDHCDNAASGGTMDSTTVLGAIIEAGLEDVAAFAICDPAAVEQAIAAGVGASVELEIGGKIRAPAVPSAASKPLQVGGIVKTISAGTYRNKGPMSKGQRMSMGRTVVLDTGRVDIVLVSDHQEPNDENAFLSLGIDPAQKRFLMIKSRVHWRAGLGHIAGEIIDCAGAGVCTSEYAALPFAHLSRPIFPLDDAAWERIGGKVLRQQEEGRP